MLPPDSPELEAQAQFVVPRDAAEALDVPAIIAAAECRGVKLSRIEKQRGRPTMGRHASWSRRLRG
jgi:hypothetical protein